MNKFIKAFSSAALLMACIATTHAQTRSVEYIPSSSSITAAKFENALWHRSDRGVSLPEAKREYLLRTHADFHPRAASSMRWTKPANPLADNSNGGRHVIKASLYYSDAWGVDDQKWGMYSIPADGGDLTLITSEDYCKVYDYVANGGGTPFGDNHYFICSYSFTGSENNFKVTNVMNAILDATTWESVKSKLQKDDDGMPNLASLSTAITSDPTTGLIYGSFFGYDDNYYSFGTYDPKRYTLNVISLLDTPWAACGFTTDGQLYALKSDGKLCKIDKRSGEETVVGDTGVREVLSSTGAINPDDNMFYYVLAGNSNTAMYKIDLSTAKATKAFDFAHNEQLFGMYFSDPAASDLAPRPASNLSANFAGQLTGKVKFTLPSQDISGSDLSGTLDWSMKVNYESYTSGKGAPGEAVETEVTVPEKGAVMIEVSCSNEHGVSTTVRISAMAGDIPALPNQPTNFSLREDLSKWGRTYATWTAPETDVNGKPINPEDVVYYVSDRNLTKRYYEIPSTSLVHDMGDLSEIQDFESLTVQSGCLMGNGYQYNWDKVPVTPVMSIGKPYPIPFSEPIENMSFKYNWVMTASPSHGHWNFWDDINAATYSVPTYNGDAGMVLFQAERDNAVSSLRGGKIDLGNAEHPTFFLQMYKLPFLNELLGVVIMEANDAANGVLAGTWSNHAESEDEIGWHEIRVPLDKFKGKTIQIELMAGCQRNTYFIALDNFEVRNLLENDLAVTKFSTPGQLIPGQKVSFGATVHNWGSKDAESFTVSMYHNGKLIDSRSFEAIASGEDISMVFDLMPTPLFDAKNEFYVEITTAADDDLGNNISEKVVLDLAQYNYPTPLSLDGEEDGEGLLLTWEEPLLNPEEAITEGFDTYPAYVISGFGQWITYDGDGYSTYGINSTGTTQYPHFSEPQAWQIFSNSFFPTKIFDPHSGAQFAISFTSGGDNNDWLISPPLSGNEQTISFYATGADMINPNPDEADHETFEILYSTESANPDDFILLRRYENINNFWMRYQAKLPEGAKYFAIRHLGCYDDSFGLLVDDVTYECEGFDNLNLTGFNVYCDGQRLNDEPLGEMEYLIEKEPAGVHTYHVTAVYEEGESNASEPFQHGVSGVDNIAAASGVMIRTAAGSISISGAAESNVAVYNLAGQLVAATKGDCTVRAAAGVYIVKVGTSAYKIAVK